jgi:hypothetical protein
MIPSVSCQYNAFSVPLWLQKETNDLGWAYIAIFGKSFSKVVSVFVSNENDRQVV